LQPLSGLRDLQGAGARRGSSPPTLHDLRWVILVGRIASAPELRYTPSGSAVAQLRLATNEGEEPQFHQLSAWGKLAEFAASYLKKGRLLYVEGRLHWSSWRSGG
jgi:single-strand DNA-binding protein